VASCLRGALPPVLLRALYSTGRWLQWGDDGGGERGWKQITCHLNNLMRTYVCLVRAMVGLLLSIDEK
jgi:hypothetical protein